MNITMPEDFFQKALHCSGVACLGRKSFVFKRISMRSSMRWRGLYVHIIIYVYIHYHLGLYTLSFMFVPALFPYRNYQYGGLWRFWTGSSNVYIYIHIYDLFSAHNFYSHRDYRYRGRGGSVLYMYIYFFFGT